MEISMTTTPPDHSIQVKTRAEWRAWLAANHRQPDGPWLIVYKKATGKGTIDYNDAVEEALCFGWIDSKPNKLDAERTMLWFAPRKSKTGWSKLNKERIERLMTNGPMMPAGLAKIEAAKQNGSWALLDAIEALEIPLDLVDALAAYPQAADYFEAFPRSAKRGILEWIGPAKKPETHAKRIEETARLAEQNIRANQWKPSLPNAKNSGNLV
jgi:uncharacterized protein YdeI (YjbR/CyaY-like superfamily)